MDTVNEKDIYYSDTSLTLNGFESGKNYKFEVRSTDPFCSGSVLYYIYVTTPYFNPYYNDPICEGVSYKYCNKWQKNDLSYDEFIENVQNYKKEIIVKPDNPSAFTSFAIGRLSSQTLFFISMQIPFSMPNVLPALPFINQQILHTC